MRTTVVSLRDANEVLRKFGIALDSKACRRRRRDEGFRWIDLEELLSESLHVLAVDWRESLQDVLESIAPQLYSIGLTFDSDLNDAGKEGMIEIDGEWEKVKYRLNDDLDDVIRSINRLTRNKAEYRRFRSCEGTDVRWYGFLSKEDWARLESNVPNVLSLLFCSVDRK
jgi:hypothetical protein